MPTNPKKPKKTVKKQNVRPGHEAPMTPKPIYENPGVLGANKLLGKVAIITGGDSGIGRAVAISFAKEGADIVIVYLNEHQDADFTKQDIIDRGRRCITIAGDVGSQYFCEKVIQKTIKTFGKLDILINNAAEQTPQESVEEISKKQLENTFRTNVFSYFFLTQAALPYLKKGAAIVNTSSVTAYRGSEHLLDYAASKGAIVAFTRSLAKNLVDRGIRVNAVAPGPIWTPLIVSTFDKKAIAEFGSKTPMKRPGQPAEVAPCFVLLASEEGSYITGQVLHPNGGEIVNA